MRGANQVSPNGSTSVNVLLATPGDWLVNCFEADDHPTAIFQVTDA